LTKIPGIGKKTAERLLLELRDKLDAVAVASSAGKGDGQAADITNALLSLGYNEREAGWALKQIPGGTAVADGIRQALKLLSKQ
jgi:Holliday junction DNA helicase RuvA